MKDNYSLLSATEPTEEQLKKLMQDVLVDVLERAEIGKKNLEKQLLKDIQDARIRYNKLLKIDEKE